MASSSTRYVFVALLAFCAVTAIAASVDGIRFTTSPSAVQTRIEVRSLGGTLLYDSDWKNGNLLDWPVQDGFSHPLAYGSYRVRVLSKDLAGRTIEYEATLRVEPGGVAIDGQPNEPATITLTAHDGQVGQLVTTSGDLTFRFGDFLNRKDAEMMRLTAEGNLGIGTDKPEARLDVNGLIRTSEGVVFPDGSIQRSAMMPSIVRMRPSIPESDKKLNPKSDIAGNGTTNQVTKWINGPSELLGDSIITEVAGKVGFATTNPGGQLHIYGLAFNDVFAGMGPDIINGPGFNYGYAGGSFGEGAGFFNVRPDLNASGVNPSLRFMTIDQQRMIITNTGNVGIGSSGTPFTGNPSHKLAVGGNVALSGNLVLPLTASANAGVITLGGDRFAYSYGQFNTFLGTLAGNFTMTGGNNTATGFEALQANTSGDNDTATGLFALTNNTTGFRNTGIGASALNLNTTGSFNTAVGDNALHNNSTGINNIGIGDGAGASLTTGNSNIDIGHQGVAAEGNTIRIGDSQARAFIAGVYGKTTEQATAIPVLVDNLGQFGTVSSSRRFKFDIADMGDATDSLMRLRPVTFRYLKYGENGPQQYGLIAEEVAEIYPELVARNKDGEVETVMYQFLAPMLLNQVQRQQKTIDRLEQRLEALEKQLANR